MFCLRTKAVANKFNVRGIPTFILFQSNEIKWRKSGLIDENMLLEELKKAFETKDLAVIDPALEKINEAWKAASEEMYKAQQSQQGQGQEPDNKQSAESSDDIEDVDFEEVKD